MKNEIQYTKSALMQSERYRDRQDLLSALLADDQLYTISAVDRKIKNYLKGMVK